MGPDTEFIVVLTTFPIDKDVESFATTLVTERLAACVNIMPTMKSIYAWKGAMERSAEHQLLIKTTTSRLLELETRLRSLHPYEVPEFVVIPIIEGSHDYLSWIVENTNK